MLEPLTKSLSFFVKHVSLIMIHRGDITRDHLVSRSQIPHTKLACHQSLRSGSDTISIPISQMITWLKYQTIRHGVSAWGEITLALLLEKDCYKHRCLKHYHLIVVFIYRISFLFLYKRNPLWYDWNI